MDQGAKVAVTTQAVATQTVATQTVAAQTTMTRGREVGDMADAQAEMAAHAEVTAHVWHGALDGEQAAADLADTALLSPAERNRARLLGEGTCELYIASHVAGRRVLASYLGMHPAGIRLGRRLCPECGDPSHGPPAVVWPRTALTYSLTASAGQWVLAVTEDSQIGVDLEANPTGDPEQAAPLALTPTELAYVQGLIDPAARRAAFLRCWTRKEAVVKAVGVGLVADLRAIETDPARLAPVTVHFGVKEGPQDWIVQDLPLGPGRHAALARQAPALGPVRLYEYSLRALPGPPAPGQSPFLTQIVSWPTEK
jgi:4'-phosphopantetheinyl transferase